ncbi:MAG TPA: hypothetical protein DDW84_08995 [Phycisphaerales bacterium]|nr:MAG: hypothetical protein A2Y13_04705 [Planctomycetes bacterium GWC2_45_44]HBG78955.1 hypothetical protein [Phycisphaerales bacterium]HBR19281.1 hypothetical protein [Phycisphaerales bacterium]
MAEKQKPVLEIRSGKIKASVWEREKTLQSGQKVIDYSIKVVKSYHDDKTKEWKETDCFFPDELLTLAAIATEVNRLIGLAVTNNM